MACLKPATGTNTVVYYVQEVDCGVTPDTPAWTPLRFTSGIPQLTRESFTSEELDGSREINGFRLGQKGVAGDVNLELSHGSHDDMLAAAMQSSWVAGATDAAVEITVDSAAKTFTRSAGDFTATFAVGDIVKFPSLATANQGGFYITTLTATVMTCAGAKDLVDETTETTDVVQADKLVVGNTVESFSLLVHYTDLNSGAGGYDIIRGCELSTMNLAVALNANVTGSFGIIGKSYEADATLPVGSTFNAASTTRPYSSFDGRLMQDGAVLGFVTSISPTSDNSAEAVYAIGSDFASHISFGKMNNTFSLETFFFDYTKFNKFANGEATRLDLILSLDGNSFGISYPNFYYTEGGPDVAGPGDISENLSGQAIKTPTTSSIILQRIS
jgi:hypothetical protein